MILGQRCEDPETSFWSGTSLRAGTVFPVRGYTEWCSHGALRLWARRHAEVAADERGENGALVADAAGLGEQVDHR